MKFRRQFSESSSSRSFGAAIQFGAFQQYFNYTADAGSMLPFYAQIFDLKPSAKVMIYSGTADFYTVPFTFSFPCIHELVTQGKASSVVGHFIDGSFQITSLRACFLCFFFVPNLTARDSSSKCRQEPRLFNGLRGARTLDMSMDTLNSGEIISSSPPFVGLVTKCQG